MDNTCKYCEYWKMQHYDSGTRSEMGCEYDVWPNKEQPNTAFRIEVSALDDSGLEAVLITGPDFGCIHFKPFE